MVKCVQCHLGGRLADALRRQGANHFAWLGLGLLESGLDLAEEPVERFVGHLEYLCDAARGEVGSEQDLHECCGVLVGLFGQVVLAADDFELVCQLLDAPDNLDGIQVGGSAEVHVEDFLCVCDQALFTNGWRECFLFVVLVLKVLLTLLYCKREMEADKFTFLITREMRNG